ncbi:hypothetical protein BACCIP111899_03335 [Bacillus rhizoplanae]|uniref:GYD domain-containing protein n=1 Tax=Bacillus rhizoplanae TaxID=2880966 RepID=A0ABM8YEA7_9BACI|nr:GYD domain-containing protein [Bacillus rhizoplanae]CAG9614108.1 hypothetical protein BACCIP111899_03335 [Bacillus rhizoplanae]
MQKYILLAKFNREGNVNVKNISERFSNLHKNYERFGGRILTAYAIVGEYDMVITFEAPDILAVKKIDLAGKLPGMVETKIFPLLEMDEFQQLVTEI